MSFRGINSSDPDGDIVAWSIGFADGSLASGDGNERRPRMTGALAVAVTGLGLSPPD